MVGQTGGQALLQNQGFAAGVEQSQTDQSLLNHQQGQVLLQKQGFVVVVVEAAAVAQSQN